MSVSVLGVPFDANSSYLRGSAKAPKLIREALFCDSANTWTESGIDVGAAGFLHDERDLELAGTVSEAFAKIEAAVGRSLESGRPLICLGGDHSITYPIIRGFQPQVSGLTILLFDAHPDLYNEFEGNRFSHACQFARIMEENRARRLVQVGIRTMTGHQREQAARFGVEVIPMRDLSGFAGVTLEGPVYVSFDMDVLDPAFAPGVSHYEPGGMSVREALAMLQQVVQQSPRMRIVGADIVEYNPIRDRDTQTAMVAAKVLREIASAMAG
jgi:agmatinase